LSWNECKRLNWNLYYRRKQDAEESYKGTLLLAIDTNNRIIASGLLLLGTRRTNRYWFWDAILVNFNYKGDNNEVLKVLSFIAAYLGY
jgi:hypothetical protein